MFKAELHQKLEDTLQNVRFSRKQVMTVWTWSEEKPQLDSKGKPCVALGMNIQEKKAEKHIIIAPFSKAYKESLSCASNFLCNVGVGVRLRGQWAE